MYLTGYSLVHSLCLVSLIIFERIPGLIWFGSVYLVTTAGFVANQFM